ncbi:MAG TPA: vanadium-dependent haloperoxidase [Vicinamibacteria bacterium]|jgi:hypothetical protein|nr:vanadium-dependent haloperoxidase [Vicinamibacteria bacterium]
MVQITRCRSAASLAAAITLLFLCTPGAARGDVLWDWTDAAMTAATGAKQLPFEQTRTMAILHVAMFDAVNAIERSYAPYRQPPVPASGASPEAAAAAAGHAVLTGLFPEQRATWDVLLASSLSALPGGPRQGGLDLGSRVGAVMVALRAQDGADAPNAYRPLTAPGSYVPTALPVGSAWGEVTPWALRSGAQFRAGGPPDLKGATWAKDYDEVKALGEKRSATRTPQQTEVARFWSITGPASWLPVVRNLTATPGRSLVQNARLLALVSMATADSYIAVFDAKYHYQFWRPITAIRNGDLDGNDATAPDATWEPLIDTPLHPEYPCAHCINSGAAAAVLEAEFGAGELPAIRMTSAAVPGVTHQWTRIRDYAAEVSSARIWGGIHYRNSTEVGAAMGRQIGEWTLKTQLGPQGAPRPAR